MEPTPAELDSVSGDPELLQIARQATIPIESELRALRRPASPGRVHGLSGPGIVLVAVMAGLMLWFAMKPGGQPAVAELPLMHSVRLAGEAQHLGPDIDLRGIGEVTLSAAGPDGYVLRLERGAVHFEVDPEGTQRNLRVLAGETVVSVQGTVFDVYFIDGRAAVDVTRGRVRVESDGWAGSLGAGQRWTAEQPVQFVRVPGETTEIVRHVLIDSPETAGSDSRVVQARSSDDLDLVAAFTRLLDRADDPTVPDRTLLGEIEAFTTAHPSSIFEVDAAALQLEVEGRIRPVWQIVPEIDAFLQAHPGTPRRLSLLELRATLHRENQDCEEALPTYRTLATEAVGDQAARAEAWRGLCARQLGRDGEARASLRRALDLGLTHPLEAEVRLALEASQP